MTNKKEEMDRTIKEKLAPKKFIKNPINGTKFTLLISSAKGGVGKSTIAVNLAFALQNLGLEVSLVPGPPGKREMIQAYRPLL